MIETFGEYLKNIRTSNGLTLTQMGARIGLDSGALSKVENGKKLLDSSVLPKLAKAFNLDLEILKDEFFSEKIAKEVFNSNCSDKVLTLAIEKVKVIKTKNIKQGDFKF